jgi:hypothetical protein
MSTLVLVTVLTSSELFTLPREHANRYEPKRTENTENLSISVNEGYPESGGSIATGEEQPSRPEENSFHQARKEVFYLSPTAPPATGLGKNGGVAFAPYIGRERDFVFQGFLNQGRIEIHPD